jgi:AcrR family transcriptional regulator
VGPVKTRQQIAAEETRRVIVAAAATLFLERGYRATSIGDIAAAAGVAVQTIYNSIGPKREVLSRVLDFAAAGQHAPTPVVQFMREQAEGETEPSRVIDHLVAFWQEALPRTAPVFRVIREAAALDSDAAALDRERAAQRLRNYKVAAQLLHDKAGLRANLTADQAAAAIFAIGHPEIYRTLVTEGEWDQQRWAQWARATLAATLLDG